MINLPDSPNLRMIKSGALGRERRPAGPRGSRWWEPLPRVTALHAKSDPRRLTMRSPELQVLPSFKPVVKVAYAPYQVPVDRAPRAPARRRALLRRRVPRGAPRGADRLRRGQGANGELKEVFEDVWVVEGLFRMGPLMHIKARPTPFSPPPPPTHTHQTPWARRRPRALLTAPPRAALDDGAAARGRALHRQLGAARRPLDPSHEAPFGRSSQPVPDPCGPLRHRGGRGRSGWMRPRSARWSGSGRCAPGGASGAAVLGGAARPCWEARRGRGPAA